jgi:hypothetical protein
MDITRSCKRHRPHLGTPVALKPYLFRLTLRIGQNLVRTSSINPHASGREILVPAASEGDDLKILSLDRGQIVEMAN